MFYVDTNTGMEASGSNWVLANHNVVGYYRVNYDDGNWQRLLNTLSTNHTVRLLHSNTMTSIDIYSIDAGNKHLVLVVTMSFFLFLKDIPRINRAQLIDDAFNLARY